jgi:hypothetical protein
MTSTVGRMLACWGIAVIGVGAVVAGLALVHEMKVQSRLSGIRTVMAGTSLVLYGVGEADGGAEALAFGPAPFLRVGYGSGTERQVFALARSAVAAGARDLFIEINPIVSRFAHSASGCGTVSWIRQERSDARDALRAVLLGSDVLRAGTVNMEGFPLPESRVPLTEVQIRRLFPIRVTGSCDANRWAALFAANPQMRVVLMVMPRAPEARGENGAQLMAEFHAVAQDFARLTGAHLFVADPDGVWPASDFVDQAHLSDAGAARFRAALAAFDAELS